MRYNIIAIAAAALFIFLILVFPSWSKHTPYNIDWSKVTDDPDIHLTYELVEAASYEAHMLDSSAYAKTVLEARFNITLNYSTIDPVSYNRKGPLSLAAGLIPDVFQQPYTSLKYSAKHGFIIPIPLYVLIEHAPTYVKMINENTDLAWMAGRVKNQNYCIPNISFGDLQPIPGVWRKDWLKAVDINKIPNTIKEYEVAFKLFKNNKPDAKSFIAAFEDGLDVSQKQKVLDNAHPTWGMSGDIINWRTGMFTEIFGAYNIQPFQWISINGSIEWGGIQIESKQALEKLREWYQAGYIHPDFTQDHHSREVFQKIYSSITGYIAYWATFIELHPDRERIRTMGNLQRERDKEILANLGISKSKIEDLIEKANSGGRYENLWSPAFIPAGPNGHRGNRISGTLGQYTTPFVFGKQMANQPEKVIRWLRMIETALNDDKLMTQVSIGKEGLHWYWHSPGSELDDRIIKLDNVKRNEYGDMYYSTYDESTTVALPPYHGWLKRVRQGLVYDHWNAYNSPILGIPLSENLRKKYQSNRQLEWQKTYRSQKLGDQCIFGDTEGLAPEKLIPIIKQLIAFQQSAYAEFINGERNLDSWNEFVLEFENIGGKKATIGMRKHFDEIMIINTSVDSLISLANQ